MDLGWKWLLPLSIVNVLLTALLIVWRARGPA
jgi:NADH:ubiquinone oxidoreductase subunit H